MFVTSFTPLSKILKTENPRPGSNSLFELHVKVTNVSSLFAIVFVIPVLVCAPLKAAV